MWASVINGAVSGRPSVMYFFGSMTSCLLKFDVRTVQSFRNISESVKRYLKGYVYRKVNYLNMTNVLD